MPVTLAQAALNTQDDLDALIIDEFRKSSAILDALPFHDTVNPMGGGTTLTYGYHRLVTQRSAAFRPINSEYTAEEVTKERFTVDLKPLGGSFRIDRVLNDIARSSETALQLQQLIKATRTRFQDEVINGDVAVDANGFDGLDKALTGSTTEVNAAGTDARADWVDLDAATYTSQRAYDLLDELFGVLDGPPSLLISNDLVAAKLRAIARRANVYVERPVEGLRDSFGNPINRQMVGNAVLVDAGEKAGSSQRIVPVYDPDNSSYTITHSTGTDGGTFRVRVDVNGDVDETDELAWNISTADLDTALEGLSNVPAGAVTVTGSAGVNYTVTFAGGLAGLDVVLSVVDDELLDTPVLEPTVVAEAATTGGYSDLYTVRIDMADGFHGVSTTGSLVRTWLPDFTTSGAVKDGECEMGPVAVALKSTKAAAVLRRIKVR
jgi:hypothetical protein